MTREISTYNFDEWLFDYFEGTLNAAEKERFNDFVAQNPELQKELLLWEKSQVASDNIEVPKEIEEELKRPVVFWTTPKILAAVVLALLIFAALYFFNAGEEDNKILPEEKKEVLSAPVEQVFQEEKKVEESPVIIKKEKVIHHEKTIAPAVLIVGVPDSLLLEKKLLVLRLSDHLPQLASADSTAQIRTLYIPSSRINWNELMQDPELLQEKLEKMENSLFFQIVGALLESAANNNYNSSSGGTTNNANSHGKPMGRGR
ncbi:MAG: hypothetical protein ACKOXB_09950 [Flavobacteriales bacterium]